MKYPIRKNQLLKSSETEGHQGKKLNFTLKIDEQLRVA